MNPGRILLMAVGLVAGLAGVTVMLVGGWLLWSQSRGDGYVTGGAREITSSGHAITAPMYRVASSPTADALPADSRSARWLPDAPDLSLRVSVTPDDASDTTFVGIAASTDLDRYLEDVAHTEVRYVTGPGWDLRQRDRSGVRSPAPPATQDLWVASTQGDGTQTLEWDAEPGTWSVVVMNADASPQVEITATGGARVGLLGPVAWVLLIVGTLVTTVAVVLFRAGGNGRGRGNTRGNPSGTPDPAPGTPDGVPRVRSG